MVIAVVMPAWNEGEGIAGFIRELNMELEDLDPTFVVVDDCSRDNTASTASALAAEGVRVRVHRNEVNSGHGPSTLTALRLGLEAQPAAVVAIDGDGQFVGVDVRGVVDQLLTTNADIVEGVRTSRHDPLYRRAVSTTTRLLVWTRAREMPADANTPLRAYRPPALTHLLASIPPNAMTPNLLTSALARRWGLDVRQVPVRSIPRRGADTGGSTWGKSRRSLPTRRFVSFCANAAHEWVTTPIGSRPSQH